MCTKQCAWPNIDRCSLTWTQQTRNNHTRTRFVVVLSLHAPHFAWYVATRRALHNRRGTLGYTQYSKTMLRLRRSKWNYTTNALEILSRAQKFFVGGLPVATCVMHINWVAYAYAHIWNYFRFFGCVWHLAVTVDRVCVSVCEWL